MRRLIAAACVLACFLTGCGAVSLGDRAIVKAIYLDRQDDTIYASIVVFGCRPTTDAASAEGQASIYSGQGTDVSQALADAESQQTKDPFYAQNGLLLLGKGCMEEDPSPILDYFGQEDASRKDLAIYLTPMTSEEFSDCEEVIADVIREAEGLAGASGGRGAFGTHEVDCAGGFSGLLPILEIDRENSAAGVTQAMLFSSGEPCGTLEDAQLQLSLLLLGKTGEMEFEVPGEQPLSVSIRGASIRRNMPGILGPLQLKLAMTGTILSVSSGGRVLYAEQADVATQQVNEWIESTFKSLKEKTFDTGNDLFGFTWWLRGRSDSLVRELEERGALESGDRVVFTCNLRHG